jgi:hypothetical protein
VELPYRTGGERLALVRTTPMIARVLLQRSVLGVLAVVAVILASAELGVEGVKQLTIQAPDHKRADDGANVLVDQPPARA